MFFCLGKSLHIKRTSDKYLQTNGKCTFTTIRLSEKIVEANQVIKKLCQNEASVFEPNIIHIDITPAVSNYTLTSNYFAIATNNY